MTNLVARRWTSAGVALLLAACVPPTKIVSKKAPDARLERKRVFVQSALPSTKAGASFGEEFARGFDARLAETLKKCGTDVQVLDVTGLEMNALDDALRAIQAFKPDTVVMISKNRGWVTGATLTRGIYDVDMFDVPSVAELVKSRGSGMKPIWRSSIDVSRGATLVPLETRGRSVSIELTNQLKADGFFPGCPKDEDKEAPRPEPVAVVAQ